MNTGDPRLSSSIVARSTLRARIEGTKGVASRIALTLADSPFPAEACNTPSLAAWPCSSGLLPLFRQPPPLLPAFSASASAFVHALPYPNSYPRKHGYVHRPQDDAKFLVLPHRLAVFTDYECTSLQARPLALFFISFLSPSLSSFFPSLRNTKRKTFARPLCQLQRFLSLSLPLFFFFYSSPPSPFPQPRSIARPFLHAPNTCGPSLEFFLLSQEEIETYIPTDILRSRFPQDCIRPAS